MEIKRLHKEWRYFRYLLIFILIAGFGMLPLRAQETNSIASAQTDAVVISQTDLLQTLVDIEEGTEKTVRLELVLDNDTFRQIKLVFPKIKGSIHLDMSACTLGGGTVSLGGTFKDCLCLRSVIIPEGILYSGDEVFMGCKNLVSVSLPESLQIIFSSAFSGCASLETITIPSKVTTIGKNAFLNCSKIQKIVIPEKVTGIGSGAFAGCSSLKDIVITSKSRKYTYVSGILFEQISGGKAIHSYILTGNVPLIPPDVIAIFERAFYNNSSLYSVIIPDNIKTIGDEAFANCTALLSIEIPGSVSFVGRDNFAGCSSLQEIVIRKSRKIPSGWDKGWLGNQLYGIIKFNP